MPREKRPQREKRFHALPHVLWAVVFGLLDAHYVFLHCRLVCTALAKVCAKFDCITGSTKQLAHFLSGPPTTFPRAVVLRDDGPFVPWQGLTRLSLTAATRAYDLRDCLALEEVKLDGLGFGVWLDDLPLLRVVHIKGAEHVFGLETGFPFLEALHLLRVTRVDEKAVISCIENSPKLVALALGVRLQGQRMLTVLRNSDRPWSQLVLDWSFFRGIAPDELNDFVSHCECLRTFGMFCDEEARTQRLVLPTSKALQHVSGLVGPWDVRIFSRTNYRWCLTKLHTLALQETEGVADLMNLGCLKHLRHLTLDGFVITDFDAENLRDLRLRCLKLRRCRFRLPSFHQCLAEWIKQQELQALTLFGTTISRCGFRSDRAVVTASVIEDLRPLTSLRYLSVRAYELTAAHLTNVARMTHIKTVKLSQQKNKPLDPKCVSRLRRAIDCVSFP